MTAPTIAPGLVRPAPFSASSSARRMYSSCRKEGLHEVIGGEFNKVIHFLADADESNRNLEIFRNRRHHAPLGGSVEFRQDEPCDSSALRELARLREAV